MSEDVCIHEFLKADCAICKSAEHMARGSEVNRVGHEKLLIFCPAITDDSLLHFNRQGDSYRLRAYVGRLAGRPEWVQPDAPTSINFLQMYALQFQIDIASERISVGRTDRWATIITAHNRRLGIGD